MSNKLRLVVDTNVLIVSFAPNTKYSWIFDALFADKFELAISNEVLLEYQEQLSLRYGLTNQPPWVFLYHHFLPVAISR